MAEGGQAGLDLGGNILLILLGTTSTLHAIDSLESILSFLLLATSWLSESTGTDSSVTSFRTSSSDNVT